MRNASPALVALLNSGTQFAMADLFTFTLPGGLVLRYTSADKPQPWNGNTWAVGPLIKRSLTKLSVGIAVDRIQMTVSAGPDVQVNGVPFMGFLSRGGLDGARLTVERLFRASWADDPAGSLLLFGGRINEVDMSRYEATVTAHSDIELLDAPVPRNVYQPGCMNVVYDTACGVSRAAFTVTGAVQSSPAPTRSFFKSALGQADAWFDLGVVAFTSGANAGVSRTVKSYGSAGAFTLIAPFPYAPAVGDTFSAYPGCNQTKDTCSGKFANLARFRGQPFIPVPETVA